MEPPPDPDVDDVHGGEDVVFDEGLVSCHAEIRVSDGADDAGVNPHTCLFSSRDNEVYLGTCVERTASVTSGVRFEGVTVPPGGIVTGAFLRVTIDGPYDAAVAVSISGEDVASSQDFVSGGDVAGRTKTDASVPWAIPDSDRWTLGGTRETPDFSAVVQEIVDRPDWAAGNPLTVIFSGDVAGTDPNEHRRFIAVDRREYTPALLVLDYLAPSCES